ncbi:MAG: glycosyltransferase family 4 protein [Reichenbachiella sp.]
MGKRQIHVLIDTTPLLYTITGIKSYTNGLCEAAQVYNQRPSMPIRFILFPNLGWLNTTFFKGELPKWKRYLFHSLLFTWKQFILPIVALFYRVDTIICPDFIAPTFTFGIFKVAVIHDAFLWNNPENYGIHWLKFTLSSLLMGIKNNATVLTTSFYSKEKIRPYIPSKIPIEILYQYHGVHRHTEPNMLPTLKEFGLTSGKYILHVGYFDKRKNLATLVKAFEHFDHQIKGYKLVLAGGRSWDHENDDFENIKELIAVRGLKHRVLLPGYIDDKTLSQLYAKAEMYVFPSLDEGFGIPILEAMRHDTPVIVSDSGALTEIGQNAVISFKTLDHLDLADKMISMVQNPELRTQLIEEGKKRVLMFTKNGFIEKLEHIVISHYRK